MAKDKLPDAAGDDPVSSRAEGFRRKAIKELPKNLKQLVFMRDSPATSEGVRLAVIKEINDRAIGKPFTPTETNVNVSGTVLHVVTAIARSPQQPFLEGAATGVKQKAIT